MRETSHRGDGFISQILSSRSVTWIISFTDSINFFIHFSSVVITQLTGSSDGKSNSGWMPSSDTSYSSVTSMGFFLLMFDTESFNDTSNSVTFGNSESIEHLVLLENLINIESFFEHSGSEINFSGRVSSVNLNFHNVIFFLSQV